ncbi:hypothetical protein ACFV6Z_28195 [Streptomyces sp. NPDC059818]|uniref:hypothetical protein n=1 Tax=Streptomyces sp. NPDC059818 TaxID=3346962 RepID=UPI003656982F
MGLCLFPEDGNTDGPDACFSYHEFSSFRRHLASAEGIALDAMQGFGGDSSWDDFTTVLEPLLNHPDDHGRSISFEECGLILPHLEGLLSDLMPTSDTDPEVHNLTRQLNNLIVALRVCVQNQVALGFM